MLIKQLTSSSSGNCTIIESNDAVIMIDAGLSAKKAAELYNKELVLDALLITHQHRLGASLEQSNDKLLGKNVDSKYCSKRDKLVQDFEQYMKIRAEVFKKHAQRLEDEITPPRDPNILMG